MFVSVDLGNSRIMMMAAERQSDGTFKIIAVEKEETPIDSIQNGVVRKPSEIASTISRLLKQMENRLENKLGNKYEIKNFYTAVNGRSLRSIRHDVLQSFPVATEIGASELNDLRKALLGKLDTEHHMYSVTNEEYRIDGNYVRNPMNIVCREISANYLLVMGRSDIRENLDKCINRIAISDVYSDALAPVAMADALLTNDDRTNGVIHLNFGAATTTVTVYQDGYLRHLAVVPFGGKHITADLSMLGITINEAEMVKKQKGTPIIENAKGRQISLPIKPGIEPRKLQLEAVSEIIEARLAEIINLVMSEVERSGFISDIKNGIVVSGAAARMTDFNEYVAAYTNMSVRTGTLSHLVDGEYPDTTLEYPLLIGLLIHADEPSVVEKPKETETPTQREETLQPKGGKKTTWFERFKQGSLFDGFDGPDGATIQD